MNFYTLLLALAFGLVGVNLQAMDLEVKKDAEVKEAFNQSSYADLFLLDKKLIEAVHSKNHEEAERLLKLGANPNTIICQGDVEMALVHKALLRKDLKMVDLFLAHRATDPRGMFVNFAKNEGGERVVKLEVTLLDRAAERGHHDLVVRLAPFTASERLNKPLGSALVSSCQDRNLEATMCLLLNGAGIKIDQSDIFTGETALHKTCVINRNVKIRGGYILFPKVKQLECLLFFGANPKLKNNEGCTARGELEASREGFNYSLVLTDANRLKVIAYYDKLIKTFDVFDKKDSQDGSEFDEICQKTAGEFVEKALKPSTHGNAFKQLQRRQQGVSKSLNREMEHSKRESAEAARDKAA